MYVVGCFSASRSVFRSVLIVKFSSGVSEFRCNFVTFFVACFLMLKLLHVSLLRGFDVSPC